MSALDLQSLNEPQRAAVLHGDGPLLILAGAGSGKTRVITYRIAHLISDLGVAAHHIVAMTFTNKAAQEMRERVETMLGAGARGISMGTFHGLCAQILRRHIDRLGYQATFTIYDSHDQLSVVKQIEKEMNVSSERFQPQAVLGTISRFKQDLLEPGQISTNGYNLFQNQAARIYEVYQRRLQEANALDFDDLLNLVVRLFRTHEDVRAGYGALWRYILVDEYQDTNKAQYTLLRLLTQSHTNICVVGDDDQSIYRWRGATIQNILSFEKDFPGATVVKLEQNYRSTGTILSVAHELISKNSGRKPKKLWTAEGEGSRVVLFTAETETREAEFVLEEIRELARVRQGGWRDFAIFYRTNAQSRALEQRFTIAGIPYAIVGGLKFYERKEIKDVLAYFRVLQNSHDEVNLLRIINIPARGIGATTIGRLREMAQEQHISLWEALSTAIKHKALAAGIEAKLAGFIELIDHLREAKDRLPLNELLLEVLDKSGYIAMLNQEASDEAKDRIENLNELGNEIAGFLQANGDEASLQSFLENASLQSDADGFESGPDRVVLMTVHAAKGLEFPVVFLTGMEEQLFPHSRSLESEEDIEEERRLAYVGITRAREQLYITLARTRMVFGTTRPTEPSRFLNDVNPEHLEDRTRHHFQVPAGAFRTGFDQSKSQSRARYAHMEKQTTFSASHRDAPKAPTPPPPRPRDPDDYEPSYDANTGELSTPFRSGAKVYHPQFGVGKVAGVEGHGEDMKVSVLFPGLPQKKFMAKFLQIVG